MSGTEFSPGRGVLAALMALCFAAASYALYRWTTSPADEGYAKQTRWLYLGFAIAATVMGIVYAPVSLGSWIGSLL